MILLSVHRNLSPSFECLVLGRRRIIYIDLIFSKMRWPGKMIKNIDYNSIFFLRGTAPPQSFGLYEARVFLSGEGLPGQKDAFGKPIKPGQPGQTCNPGQQGQPGQAGKPGQQGQPGQLGKPGQQVKPQQGDQQKPAGKTGKNGEPQNLTKMEIIKLKLKELKEKEN